MKLYISFNVAPAKHFPKSLLQQSTESSLRHTGMVLKSTLTVNMVLFYPAQVPEKVKIPTAVRCHHLSLKTKFLKY